MIKESVFQSSLGPHLQFWAFFRWMIEWNGEEQILSHKKAEYQGEKQTSFSQFVGAFPRAVNGGGGKSWRRGGGEEAVVGEKM